MGRVSHDAVVIQSSSISLLQERFRQLKRVKEMREEKEMLRDLLSEAEPPKKLPRQTVPCSYYEPLNLFLNPQLINTPLNTTTAAVSPPTIQLSLSLWPNGDNRRVEVGKKGYSQRDKDSSVFGNSQHAGVDNRCLLDCCFFEKFGRDDVDTSLHL